MSKTIDPNFFTVKRVFSTARVFLPRSLVAFTKISDSKRTIYFKRPKHKNTTYSLHTDWKGERFVKYVIKEVDEEIFKGHLPPFSYPLRVV